MSERLKVLPEKIVISSRGTETRKKGAGKVTEQLQTPAGNIVKFGEFNPTLHNTDNAKPETLEKIIMEAKGGDGISSFDPATVDSLVLGGERMAPSDHFCPSFLGTCSGCVTCKGC